MQGGVGRACDAPPNATIRTLWPSPDSLIPFSSTRTLRGHHPSRTYLSLVSFSLSLCRLLCSTLSRRCSSPFKQPMQYSAALGSRLWGWVRPSLPKKSSTCRSFRPSNWRRCPSTVARVGSPSLFSLAFPLVLPFPSRNFLPLLHESLLSLLISCVFIISFSFCFLALDERIEHRLLDVEALMRSLSRRWFIRSPRRG